MLTEYPFFGATAAKYAWSFDLSTALMGTGLMVPYSITITILAGCVVGYGIMLPVIETTHRDGTILNGTIQSNPKAWFGPDDGGLSGPTAYYQLSAITMMLVDATYQISVITIRFAIYLMNGQKADTTEMEEQIGQSDGDPKSGLPAFNVPEEEDIPTKVWLSGLLISILVIIVSAPNIMHGIKYEQAFVACILSIFVSVGLIYTQGLTDVLVGSAGAKVGIIVFALWVGKGGSIVAPLSLAAITLSIAGQCGDLMNDMKSALMVGGNPRTMFIGQIIGAIMGIPFALMAFEIFARSGSGIPSEDYPAHFVIAFNQIATIFVEGTDAIPKHCGWFMLGFGLLALVNDIVRDLLSDKIEDNSPLAPLRDHWPITICFALGMYLPPFLWFPQLIGCIWQWWWKRSDPTNFNLYYASVVAGLIAGEGLGSVLTAIFGLIPGVTPWMHL